MVSSVETGGYSNIHTHTHIHHTHTHYMCVCVYMPIIFRNQIAFLLASYYLVNHDDKLLHVINRTTHGQQNVIVPTINLVLIPDYCPRACVCVCVSRVRCMQSMTYMCTQTHSPDPTPPPLKRIQVAETNTELSRGSALFFFAAYNKSLFNPKLRLILVWNFWVSKMSLRACFLACRLLPCA